MGRQVVTQRDVELASKKPSAPARSALGGGVAAVEEEEVVDPSKVPVGSDREGGPIHRSFAEIHSRRSCGRLRVC